MTHRRPYQDLESVPGSVGDVLRLIRAKGAISRSALARMTGLAPSTVSLRVDALASAGLVREMGSPTSQSDRRSRRVMLDGSGGFVLAIDLGAHHVRIALTDLAGNELVDSDATGESGPLTSAVSPHAAVDELWDRFEGLAARNGLTPDALRAVAIGVPAPVAYPTGRIVTPSFQPSWDGVVLSDLFAEHTDVPVLVENDANLIALAERSEPIEPDQSQLIAVKLGTRIGGGIIARGRLHRGVSGAAGELAHTAVDGQSAIGCTCGVQNCLESVASGGAVVARLRASGLDVSSTADLLALAAQGDPVVVDELREAGVRIGRVLGSIANFFNPKEVVLAGSMSASPPLVAAIRSELYRMCLPLVAGDLDVRASRAPRDAPIRGASVLALDEFLAPARVNELARYSMLTAASPA